MPHLYRVIVPVTDIDRAAKFYAAILCAPGRRVSPGRHYFDCEGTILGACFDPQADGDGYAPRPNPEPLYFAVSDLRSTYDSCKAAGRFAEGSPPGVGPLGQIAKRPWGEESFYASDPFGNPVCFVSRASVFTG